MCRTGDRVFGDADLRSKEATDKVDISAGCGHHDAAQLQIAQSRLIGRQSENLTLIAKDSDIVVGCKDGLGFAAEGRDERGGCLDRMWMARGKIHGQLIIPLPHPEIAAECLEGNHGSVKTAVSEQDVRACKGRVPAQGHFGHWREPAQTKAVCRRDEKGGLGKVVLFSNGLQKRVRQPVVEWNDRRRITGEGPVSEGVDLILLQL